MYDVLIAPTYHLIALLKWLLFWASMSVCWQWAFLLCMRWCPVPLTCRAIVIIFHLCCFSSSFFVVFYLQLRLMVLPSFFPLSLIIQNHSTVVRCIALPLECLFCSSSFLWHPLFWCYLVWNGNSPLLSTFPQIPSFITPVWNRNSPVSAFIDHSYAVCVNVPTMEHFQRDYFLFTYFPVPSPLPSVKCLYRNFINQYFQYSFLPQVSKIAHWKGFPSECSGPILMGKFLKHLHSLC